MIYPFERSEVRNPAVIAVMVTSLDGRLSTECAFTENISIHGARVVAKQRWRTDDPLVVKSLEGDFLGDGQVVYSESRSDSSTAIGVKLLRSTGNWSPAIRPFNSRIRMSIRLKRKEE